MQIQRPLATITPTLDGDVLAVLAGAEATFTPGQVARLVPDASVEGIRKVLRRLATQGIVTSERVGQAYTYQLNREHLAAPAVLQLAQQRAALLARLQQAMDAWPVRPVHGALFGSAARGQMSLDSDIDVFLVRPDGAAPDVWETQTGELAAAVTRWTGNDTRILNMTEAEVRAGAASGDPVLRSIVEDGLTVAGRSSWLRALLRSAAAR
ncbi:MAG TPA: nucleotidyltransferase domain-containing protein [Cryobacterium sp.]|nr:nucleotidyltransferase domain-containing protein [Cryobacterium sp.]